MNRQKYTYCVLQILLWLFAGELLAFPQIQDEKAYPEQAINMREIIQFFTDRNMYAVNERIHFRSFYSNSEESGNALVSKVLYVELLTPSGNTIAKGKYIHGEGGSSGYLTIPDVALTGNYFLRAYTRWMRNFNPSYYSYLPITIINPDSQEVLKVESEVSQDERNLVRGGVRGLKCQTNKPVYSEGEEVQLELSFLGKSNSFPGEFCLTVVPAGLVDTLIFLSDTNDREEDMDLSFDFLPDIRGISLSGSIVMPDDQSPSPDTRVHFSLLGKQADYFATISDEQGRFIVTLPDRTGIQELFVVGESSDRLKREIRIDQDFSSEPVPYACASFSLSPEQKRVAFRMVLNMQLSKAYGFLEIDSLVEAYSDSVIPFYGMAPINIHMEEYIKLPTMAEVIENLVPLVSVQYKRGLPSLVFESRNSAISRQAPLILIDHITVLDQKAVFDMDPSKIERIEVINEVYMRGDLMYGGVIILTSRKKDMASVDLAEGSYFFDYQTFHKSWNKHMPLPIIPASELFHNNKPDRIPDTRNLLFWSDRVILHSGEQKTLQFSAASSKGEYHVLLRGISSRGEVIYGMGSFKVE